MIDKYVLDGRVPRKEPDSRKWALWFETADRRVASDSIGSMRISTVFLGIDHSFGGGSPLLFETMIFGGPESVDGFADRCSTWESAEAMHAAAISSRAQR